MSEEIISINDAKIAQKGSITGTIISEKSPVSKDDWSRKDFVIEDKSGSAKLTAWGDDIPKFKLGSIYELIKPQWKPYNDEVGVSPSKFGSIKCIGVAEHQEQLEAPATGKPTPDPELPVLEASIKGIIHENTILMAQIEKEVGMTLKSIYNTEPRGDKVGMYTRTLFNWFKSMEGAKND